jgi:hypothetical protein
MEQGKKKANKGGEQNEKKKITQGRIFATMRLLGNTNNSRD